MKGPRKDVVKMVKELRAMPLMDAALRMEATINRFQKEAEFRAAWNYRSGWIRTEDRLPEEGRRVLTRCEDGSQSIIFLLDGKWWGEEPTHWQPLPQAPEDYPPVNPDRV